MSVSTVLTFAPFYPPAFLGGGPARSLEASSRLAAQDFWVKVFTRDRDLGATQVLDVPRNVWSTRDGVEVRYSSMNFFHYLRSMIGLRRMRPDVVYFNSFFDAEMSIFPQLLGRMGWWGPALRLVAVRGEFGDAALRISQRRKRIYLRIYRALRLHQNLIWHASSDRERADIVRMFGASARVLVRSDESLIAAGPVAEIPMCHGEMRPAFLSRIVPIKGLHVVLEALKDADYPLHLVIYGPEEDAAYAERCRKLAIELPSHVRTSFRGPIMPDKVQSTLAEHDLLLMPTHGENFGHVIAEALSASVPVMAMDVTPWTSTLNSGGGVIVPTSTPESWASSIRTYAHLSCQDRFRKREDAAAAFRRWKASLPDGSLFSDLERLLIP